MNETMLALLGFATIIMIIVLLLRNVTVPALAFIGVSCISALILVLTGTFTVKEVGDFIKAELLMCIPLLHCSYFPYCFSEL